MSKVTKKGIKDCGGSETVNSGRDEETISDDTKSSASNVKNLPKVLLTQPESSVRSRPKIPAAPYSGSASGSSKLKLRSSVGTGVVNTTNRGQSSIPTFNNKYGKIDKNNTDGAITRQKTKMKTVNASGKLKNGSEVVELPDQPDANLKKKKQEKLDSDDAGSKQKNNTNGVSSVESKENGNSEMTTQVEEVVSQNGDGLVLQLDPEENHSTENDNAVITKETNNAEPEIVKLSSEPNIEICSVDVVGSTTSEASESVTNESPENKASQPANDDLVTYDSNITLKDVKLELNDCLREESKPKEVNDADQSNADSYAHKDLSFNRTLKTISGRRSISTMRNITIRDRQPSPNSSLFVNTSNISLSQDEDYKILRHRSAASNLSMLSNGTPINRKRKLDTSQVLDSNKKQKSDSPRSLLGSPFSFLKGFRKSESSPSNLQSKKIASPISKKIEDTQEESGLARNWCSIM